MVMSIKDNSAQVILLGYKIWIILLLGLLSSFQKCIAYDVRTSCPSTFTDNTNVILSCFVNKTYINAASCGTRPSVSFVFASSTGSSYLCSSLYPSGSCGTLPTGSFPCGCTSESGDLYTFQYNFTALNAVHHNGSITCAVRCFSMNITYFHEATCSSLVYGAPRIIPNSPMPKEITFYGDPIPVIFEVRAYPQITKAYIKAIDNASNMISSDVNMKFPLVCDESSLLYTTLCILVIKNATSADVGTHQMTLINGIGDLTINIQIFVNIKDHCACGQEKTDEGLGPDAVAGITLAVEAVVVALVLVILWRKGFIVNCRERHADRSIKTNSEMAGWSNIKNDMQVESCPDLPTMSSETGTNSQYEGLRVGEIEISPAYKSIKQETGHVYDNS